MAALHVFIDGSWLFRQCKGKARLANAMYDPKYPFRVDFQKLSAALLAHANEHRAECDAVQSQYIATSIFVIPNDVDRWDTDGSGFTKENIGKLRDSVQRRQEFVARIPANFTVEVFQPICYRSTLKRVIEKTYDEKRVDAAVVARFVRSAMLNRDHTHAILTGDSDLIPAIQAVFPEYAQNVLLVTTDVTGDQCHDNQASADLVKFDFRIPPYLLDRRVDEFVDGPFAHRCVECDKVWTTKNPISAQAEPRCPNHWTRPTDE